MQKWIQVETIKILRTRLRDCYRKEGVNHHAKCRPHVEAYLKAIEETKQLAALY